jgi:signal transduction histidine kinase
MTDEYKTSHYVRGETEPQEQPQKALSDIVLMVKNRLAEALQDKEIGLSGNHPRVIISMVITNILVNLLFNSIAVTDVGRRLEMVDDSLDEIKEMTLNLWRAMEASRADTTNPH